MSKLGLLLGLLKVGQTATFHPGQFQRVLNQAATALAFTVITAMMAGMLLIGIFYIAYVALVANGVAVVTAMVIVGATAFTITALLALVTVKQIEGLKDMPRNLVSPETSSLTSRVTGIAESFVDGFLHPHTTTIHLNRHKDLR